MAVSAKHSKKFLTRFVGIYILVSATASWLLGFFEFSFLWVFISIGGSFIVWKAMLQKIIAQQLRNKEANLYWRLDSCQDGTAEWFTFLLNRWWVFSSANINELVKKKLDECIRDIDSLELSNFSVGEQTPNIKNIRMYECGPGRVKPMSCFDVHLPPAGLDKLSSYQVAMEADVSMLTDDFKMILKYWVSSDLGLILKVEDLNLTGTIQAIIFMSKDIPFPHLEKAAVCFKEKPGVTFNIRMLGVINLMAIPFLNSWIHKKVMEALTKALVEPLTVDISGTKSWPQSDGIICVQKRKKLKKY